MREIIGSKFGRLTVLEVLPERISGRIAVRCRCDCGTMRDVRADALKSGNTKSCGCLSREVHAQRIKEMRLDLSDRVFGYLTVIKFVGGDRWLCECVCGNQKTYRAGTLSSEKTKSCGCKKYDKLQAAVVEHVKNDSVAGTRKTALTAKLHKNNKTGHKGISYNKVRNKYRASIGFRGKTISLGHYETLAEAVEARKRGEAKYFAPILNEE